MIPFHFSSLDGFSAFRIAFTGDFSEGCPLRRFSTRFSPRRDALIGFFDVAAKADRGVSARTSFQMFSRQQVDSLMPPGDYFSSAR